ncbi:MAG: hypothetical protein KGL18_00020 [Burkholderiales bacterium]|nr:hypothetical protein [Burkholderiales bacterium]MDE1928811.1 hypothetical protein [Burkholderiales bacterium]MDE2159731.1 hypothetical protein [Burkholderiales bacterium]MDE2501346.1 hypothetical protein [Burkholderiales bacterium]
MQSLSTSTPRRAATIYATLVRREWLQHRLGWTLAALLPLLVGAALLAFAQVRFDAVAQMPGPDGLTLMMALVAIAGSAALDFLIMILTASIIVTGLARRDVADRSIEFWLSLPTGDGASLAVPLFVHLILVPAAALLVGLAGGVLLSGVLVGRFVGLGAWFALPWAPLLGGTLAIALRVLLGLPLAVLWLSPLIGLTMLCTAWFRRWGVVVMAVAFGIGGWIARTVFGDPLLSRATAELLRQAGHALIDADGRGYAITNRTDPVVFLHHAWSTALSDYPAALARLASPLFVGAVAVAALCFWLLVRWRRRGAGGA